MANKPNLKNLLKLRREFDRLESVVAAAAVDGVASGLAVLRAGMIARAPRGETGDLAGSIDVIAPRAARNFVGGAVVVSSDHAVAVEFGTTHEAAQPFVRPTRDLDGARAIQAVASAIEAKLK